MGGGTTVAFDPHEAEGLYLGLVADADRLGHLYHSRDSGTTWERLHSSPHPVRRVRVTVSTHNPYTLHLEYAAVCETPDDVLLRSEDAGRTWRVMARYYAIERVLSGADADHLIVFYWLGLGGRIRTVVTRDAGANWQAGQDLGRWSLLWGAVAAPYSSTDFYLSGEWVRPVINSSDGGFTWELLPMPELPDRTIDDFVYVGNLAIDKGGGNLYLASPFGVFRWKLDAAAGSVMRSPASGNHPLLPSAVALAAVLISAGMGTRRFAASTASISLCRPPVRVT